MPRNRKSKQAKLLKKVEKSANLITPFENKSRTDKVMAICTKAADGKDPINPAQNKEWVQKKITDQSWRGFLNAKSEILILKALYSTSGPQL